MIGAGVVLAASQSASAATTASFSNGTLIVYGDKTDNTIAISRDAAGTILVNGGAVPFVGGTPTVANTTLILVFGLGGNDTITLDEANGALPRASLFGGAGNDTLIGGAGDDLLFGEAGNDTLLGQGRQRLPVRRQRERHHDRRVDGNDQVFGMAGDDRMIWNPGDETALNEGGAGNDTVEVNGGNVSETFTATANGARVRFDRLDPAPFAMDIGTSENLFVNTNGGDDTLHRPRGPGHADLAHRRRRHRQRHDPRQQRRRPPDGGDGNDLVDGQQGNDVALQGAGDDAFLWDPGDGSDTIEGQDGSDTMLFNGSGGAEIFEASANGDRLRFTRNIGNIVMDINDVELVDFDALGNADTITVNDLTGTDVTGSTSTSSARSRARRRRAADTVIVNGTNGDDVIDIVGAGTSASVLGLPAQVNITNSEGANDSLVVNTLGGNDGVTASTLPAGVIELTIDGGAGDDTILGSQGADVFLGGDGNDFIVGDNGNDVAFMGAGDDVFQWDPGDGNDTLEGQAGNDKLLFFGADVDENIDISANGGRVSFFRDVATVTMDLDDVERRRLPGARRRRHRRRRRPLRHRPEADRTRPSRADGGGDGQPTRSPSTAPRATTRSPPPATPAGSPSSAAHRGQHLRPGAGPRPLTVNGLGGNDVINASVAGSRRHPAHDERR